MGLTNYAVNTFISDKVSGVTECTLADMYIDFPDAKNWLSNFGMAAIFNDHPPVERRQFALQLIRRVEMIFVEYSQARNQLLELLDKGGQWSPYFRALHHLEVTCSLVYQVYNFSSRAIAERLFEERDGSSLARLNLIYNTIKHQLAEDKQPPWITNSGISIVDCNIRFIEIEDLIGTLAKIVLQLLGRQPGEANG